MESDMKMTMKPKTETGNEASFNHMKRRTICFFISKYLVKRIVLLILNLGLVQMYNTCIVFTISKMSEGLMILWVSGVEVTIYLFSVEQRNDDELVRLVWLSYRWRRVYNMSGEACRRGCTSPVVREAMQNANKTCRVEDGDGDGEVAIFFRVWVKKLQSDSVGRVLSP